MNEEQRNREKFKANRSTGKKIAVDVVAKKAEAVRNRFLNRLIPPNRAEFDRESRYEVAKQKQLRFLNAITRILVILVKDYRKFKILEEHRNNLIRYLKENSEPVPSKFLDESVHEISMTKLYCIAAGGGKMVPRDAADPLSELYLIPITSTYNEEVKMLVEQFFFQKFRGTNLTGASKWVARPEPRFNSSVIELLALIHDQFESSFAVISEFLVSETKDLDKEFAFTTTSDVSPELLLKLRDVLLK